MKSEPLAREASARLLALNELNLLDTPADPRLDGLVRSAGIGTLCELTAEAAPQLAHADCPDLMLSDMQMAKMDGLRPVARWRADPELRATRCIAVAGDAMTALRAGRPGPRGRGRVRRLGSRSVAEERVFKRPFCVAPARSRAALRAVHP